MLSGGIFNLQLIIPLPTFEWDINYLTAIDRILFPLETQTHQIPKEEEEDMFSLKLVPCQCLWETLPVAVTNNNNEHIFWNI